MGIDRRFVVGVVVGVVGVLIIGGAVWLLAGGDGSSKNAAAEGSPSAGASKGDDKGKNDGGEQATPGPPLSLPVPTGSGKVSCPSPTTTVKDADGLEKALGAAKPGDVIRLAAGTYTGKFVAQASGTSDKPIFLCGDATAILDGGGVKKGYAFHLDKAGYWRLIGFSVQNSQKGVMADGSSGSIIQGLTVHDIGDEAIHLRGFSTGDTVQYNKIYNTGLRRAKFGEGVYLGSAESNWSNSSGGKPDKSDNNVVRGNVIRATAEAIDIKEGTSGGRILDNVFDGSALGGDKFNDSWIDVKGNGYLIQGNSGKKTLKDGFQTHQIIKGGGTGNVFRGNTLDISGADGVGINDTVGGNTIACDNKVIGGKLMAKGDCSG
ncbi:right-handed parallel beta-helix repeat-containing protein [Actinoallomurus sp. NBC_01490]|uniref:right-handed parallel beta-helix repeat-containing protein n=1 Tax=Actinoallomurus sp. NBC_01490 TaxID=2903557 RepID=UPI002E2F9BFA|nr:right-handed parallel beta-helix repeat-containing protein [Actinoallomurus sp. NBC_01490]